MKQQTHTRLPRDTCRDDDDICSCEGLFQSLVALLLGISRRREEPLDFGRGCDVGEIDCNTGCIDDIIEGKLKP